MRSGRAHRLEASQVRKNFGAALQQFDTKSASDIAKANGLVGMAGWTRGLIFSLAIGQLADRIGDAPLFACLELFDLLGAAWIFALRRRLVLPGWHIRAHGDTATPALAITRRGCRV